MNGAVPVALDAYGAPLDAEGLLARVADGDRVAMGPLYDELGAAVYALARRMLRDSARAEQVALEVFSEIWRQAPRRSPGDDAVRSWVAAIVCGSCVAVLRERAPGAS